MYRRYRPPRSGRVQFAVPQCGPPRCGAVHPRTHVSRGAAAAACRSLAAGVVPRSVAAPPAASRLPHEGARLIDAHFGYPDGDAATRLGRWLGLPVTLTLRGTEVPHSRNPVLRRQLVRALGAAARVFTVSGSLRQLALDLGVDASKTEVVGNGVDTHVFHPVDRVAARARFDLPDRAQVLISVGGLVERKGMHRVIDCLPPLMARHPDLHYLIVGGGGGEGDLRAELEAQVARLG